jgi:hypothetical protein
MSTAAKPRRPKAAAGAGTARRQSAAQSKPATPRDAAEFAKQQIERLETMLPGLVAKADGGELGAMRERILRKLSEVDARRAAAEQDNAEALDETSAGV